MFGLSVHIFGMIRYNEGFAFLLNFRKSAMQKKKFDDFYALVYSRTRAAYAETSCQEYICFAISLLLVFLLISFSCFQHSNALHVHSSVNDYLKSLLF